MSPLLLDTCALIWGAGGSPMRDEAIAALDDANRQGQPIYISPISSWEIALLVSRGKLSFTVQDWDAAFEERAGQKLADMPPAVLRASSFLPGTPPGDSADRIIIATARAYGMCIVTRDQNILDYASQGHADYLEC